MQTYYCINSLDRLLCCCVAAMGSWSTRGLGGERWNEAACGISISRAGQIEFHRGTKDLSENRCSVPSRERDGKGMDRAGRGRRPKSGGRILSTSLLGCICFIYPMRIKTTGLISLMVTPDR
jgi:hypothetical protein